DAVPTPEGWGWRGRESTAQAFQSEGWRRFLDAFVETDIGDEVMVVRTDGDGNLVEDLTVVVVEIGWGHVHRHLEQLRVERTFAAALLDDRNPDREGQVAGTALGSRNHPALNANLDGQGVAVLGAFPRRLGDRREEAGVGLVVVVTLLVDG